MRESAAVAVAVLAAAVVCKEHKNVKIFFVFSLQKTDFFFRTQNSKVWDQSWDSTTSSSGMRLVLLLL